MTNTTTEGMPTMTIDQPTRFDPMRVAAETFALPAFFPIPGLGLLPMNSFLVRGAQPVLVDSGPPTLAGELMEQLGTLMDLRDLRWIWLTHMDPDHIGAIIPLLEAAPRAKVVTSFIGLGKLAMICAIGPERAHLINPGGRLDIGDRELVAMRPPVYDAPETMAAFDAKTRALFSADTFGALLDAPAPHAGAVPDDALKAGMLTWASVDAPWLEDVPRDRFARSLAAWNGLGATTVLSAHLPPAEGMTTRLLDHLADACGRPGFVGPDQAQVEAMMAAQMPDPLAAQSQSETSAAAQ